MQGAGGLTGKRIELLKDALPGIARIGLMFNPDYSIAAAGIEQALQVANRRGLVVVPAPVRDANEIETAITHQSTSKTTFLLYFPKAGATLGA